MSTLNLARKWRPKVFKQIVGQEFSISMLQNSLFLKKLFPVYLFSGLRGCGKTSTARVFAAAVNCENLINFQKNPKATIPCLSCNSCKAMLNANHPDFIEMDAASHTGVDSVRQIIESSSYIPLSGSKKIYLIDEAHMLSKAAFNAFLKILEEPPPFVLFILATTNPEKIPDTVRSRCFHATFNAVEQKKLSAHIKQICTQEEIKIDDDALTLLIQETEGSVRDTINSLEQVRFAGQHITKELVLKSLGKISEETLFLILRFILEHNGTDLLKHLEAIQFETLSPQRIWSMLIVALRDMLRYHYGIKSNNGMLESIAQKVSKRTVHNLLQTLWDQEAIFVRTPNKHLFLETLLLTLCEPASTPSNNHKKTPQYTKPTQPPATTYNMPTTTAHDPWGKFLIHVSEINDPVLVGIFKTAQFISENDGIIELQLKNHSSFIIDKVDESQNVWLPALKKSFQNFTKFTFVIQKKTTSAQPSQPAPTPKRVIPPVSKQPQEQWSRSTPTRPGPSGIPVDTSDEAKWPKATLLKKQFDGVVEKVE